MIDLVYFRKNFYYNLSQNGFPKYRCFVKIITFVTTPLKFPNIVIFSSIRNDIGSNFVESINEWFFGERYSIYGKNGAIKKYITHLDKLIKFSYFPKHYNFHEIMLYSQYPSENFQVEIVFSQTT